MYVKDKNVTRNGQHEFTKGKSHLTHLFAFCSDWPGRPGEISVMCFVKRGELESAWRYYTKSGWMDFIVTGKLGSIEKITRQLDTKGSGHWLVDLVASSLQHDSWISTGANTGQ